MIQMIERATRLCVQKRTWHMALLHSQENDREQWFKMTTFVASLRPQTYNEKKQWTKGIKFHSGYKIESVNNEN